MNRLLFLFGFMIYIAITGIILLLKLSIGHSWFNQWIFNKFFVFQFISVVTVGLAIESNRFRETTYVRMGTRRDILRNELFGYYRLGILCLSIMFFFILFGSVLLKENGYMHLLFEWYIRYLLGTIIYINIMSCLKWSNNSILSKYCHLITFSWLAVETIVIIPYIKRISTFDTNLIFSWVFQQGAVGYVSLVILILITILLNIKISDKRDFI